MSTAVAVMGLVIEAIQQIESVRIGAIGGEICPTGGFKMPHLFARRDQRHHPGHVPDGGRVDPMSAVDHGTPFSSLHAPAGPYFGVIPGSPSRMRREKSSSSPLRGLEEALPDWVAQDPHATILLRRNLVRLLLAAGEVSRAREHVDEVAVLAARTTSPRAVIAAATTRATYELATGSTDIALTRLEEALARARSVPAALRDTLGCLVRAEESAGRPERALVRLQELSDHFYRLAVDRARDHVELSSLVD